MANGGDAPLALVERLADAVLEHPWVALALAAKQSSPHQLARALELAAAVLKATRKSAVNS